MCSQPKLAKFDLQKNCSELGKVTSQHVYVNFVKHDWIYINLSQISPVYQTNSNLNLDLHADLQSHQIDIDIY